MRRMKAVLKWAIRLVVVLGVIVVALLLSSDAILRALLERELRAQTGMDVRVGKFSLGWISPVVRIEELKLFNPPEFGGTPFLDLRELHLEYDPAALARREFHIRLLRLDLTEINVVKNDLGGTNLVALRGQAISGKPAAGDIKFAGIDVLNLSVGKMRFIDLKHRNRDREIYPNLQNQVFKNVKTTGDLYGILIMLWLRSGGGVVGVPANTQGERPISTVLAVAEFENGATGCRDRWEA